MSEKPKEDGFSVQGAYAPGRDIPYYGPDYYREHQSGYLQMSHMTKPERFPKIFDSAKEIKPDAKRVLSFGCSTGEEAFALAKRFPEAEIVGVDIDYSSVSTARLKNKEKDRIFFHTELGATGKYDLCTCLMVLFQMDSPIRLKPWDDVLRLIDKHLNPDAVLMLYTSEYNFLQSSIAVNYNIVRDWTRQHNRNGKDYFCGYYRKVRDIATEPYQEKPGRPKAEERILHAPCGDTPGVRATGHPGTTTKTTWRFEENRCPSRYVLWGREAPNAGVTQW